jgi:hypothetical protein
MKKRESLRDGETATLPPNFEPIGNNLLTNDHREGNAANLALPDSASHITETQ